MLTIEEAPGLRRAAIADWRTVGAITAEAFAVDPVTSWTFAGSGAMPTAFGQLARHVYLPRGVSHVAEGDLGATLWLTPGASKSLPAWPTLIIAARAMVGGGATAIARALAVDAEMIRRKPKAPHAYLFSIGVRPSARGQGLGRRLLAPMLAACDAAGVPAYLENSNPANFPLYQGAGFVTVDEFSPAPGCPPLWPMWREPQAT